MGAASRTDDYLILVLRAVNARVGAKWALSGLPCAYALPTPRLRTANATRIMLFIGILQSNIARARWLGFDARVGGPIQHR